MCLLIHHRTTHQELILQDENNRNRKRKDNEKTGKKTKTKTKACKRSARIRCIDHLHTEQHVSRQKYDAPQYALHHPLFRARDLRRSPADFELLYANLFPQMYVIVTPLLATKAFHGAVAAQERRNNSKREETISKLTNCAGAVSNQPLHLRLPGTRYAQLHYLSEVRSF